MDFYSRYTFAIIGEHQLTLHYSLTKLPELPASERNGTHRYIVHISIRLACLRGKC